MKAFLHSLEIKMLQMNIIEDSGNNVKNFHWAMVMAGYIKKYKNNNNNNKAMWKGKIGKFDSTSFGLKSDV